MKTRWTIGKKLIISFFGVAAITLILGVLAVVSMLNVSSVARHLSEDNVPAVAIANDVERSAYTTIYNARGYAYTERQTFLEGARQNLAQTQKLIEDAKGHATKHNMVVLAQNADVAGTEAARYRNVLEQVVGQNEELRGIIEHADEAVQLFVRSIIEYLNIQESAMASFLEQNLGSGSTRANTQEGRKYIIDEAWIRTIRIKAANEIFDESREVVANTWRAIASRDPDHLQATMSRLDRIIHMLEELQSQTRQEHNLRLLAACRAAADRYLQSMRQFVDIWLAREQNFAILVTGGGQVIKAASDTVRDNIMNTEQAAQQATRQLRTSSAVIIVGVIAAVLIALLLGIFITRGINNALRRIIDGLSSNSDQVVAAAGQVSSASQSLAEGASEQASGIEETSSSFEEMSSMTKQNADNARHADALMSETKEVVSRANESMMHLTRSMNEIAQASEETSKIVKTIDEIAFQTNLLALNAAVEAARAGEAGAGFAVVADEVRNLAMRAAEAAKNTAELIEGTVKKVGEGTSLVNSTNEAFQQVGTSSVKVAELVGEIAAASGEQAQGIDQVNKAVAEIDKVTQQNAANAEESAAAAEEMNAQAEEMKSMVEELVAMVNRSNGNGGAVRGSRAFRRVSAGKDGNGKIALPVPVTTARKASMPKEIIPLDDDFKSF